MVKSYKEHNDNELVYMINDNNESANDLLFERYKPLIRYYAKKYVSVVKYSGIEMNDLYQEGMIGLYNAVKNYKESSDVKFSTFSSVCINRAMSNAIRNANRKKQKYLNEALSLDYVYDENNKSLSDFLGSSSEYNPEKKIISEEMTVTLYKDIVKLLSDSEFQIFELKRYGLNYDEISDMLNLNKKQIVNAMQRIRYKVGRMLKEEMIV